MGWVARETLRGALGERGVTHMGHTAEAARAKLWPPLESVLS